MNSASNLASARLGTRLYAFTETARSSVQAMILDVYRNFLNSKIGAAEAEKAQVLGLDELERPQGTLGSFVKWTLLRTATGVALEQDTDARTIGPAGPPRHTSGRTVKTPAADRRGPQRCAEGRVRAQY
jgi:hypothetical protein